MIKHHPTFELIQRHVHGDLPASMSMAVTLHAQHCTDCQQQIARLTAQVAEASFEPDFIDDLTTEECHLDNNKLDSSLTNIMADILTKDEIKQEKTAKPVIVNFKGTEYVLPDMFQHIALTKVSDMGQLARARLQLNEGNIRTSLLHIEPGGSVPEHTHNGFELTVLLAGSFTDAQGEYITGDFIMLDRRHTHQPSTVNGCLCYAVVSGALHFTQGINRLLNPIGRFIY